MPKVIKSAGRDIILKVKRACEEERDNNGPTVPFSKVRARVAYLTGVSERTVTQVTQEGNVASASSSKIVTPGKTRKKMKKIQKKKSDRLTDIEMEKFIINVTGDTSDSSEDDSDDDVQMEGINPLQDHSYTKFTSTTRCSIKDLQGSH